jgi:hypothetical protein
LSLFSAIERESNQYAVKKYFFDSRLLTSMRKTQYENASSLPVIVCVLTQPHTSHAENKRQAKQAGTGGMRGVGLD